MLENLKNNEFSSNIADYLESTSLEPNLESQQFIEYLLTFNKKLFLASAAHQYSTSFKDEKLITQLFSTAVTAKRYDVMKTLIDSDFQSPKELFANLITKEPTADLNFFPRE